jgi:tetratricopeptide (TPR) repeat protein
VDHLLIAVEGYTLGKMPEYALPYAESAIKLDPANVGAHWFRVIALAWAGKFQQAIDAGTEFFRRFGDDPEIHLWLAYSYDRLGNPSQAGEHYEASVRLFGGDTNNYASLHAARFYDNQGDHARARALLEDVESIMKEKLDAYPDNRRLQAYLALAYKRLGKREAFVSLWANLRQHCLATGEYPDGVSWIAIEEALAGDREAERLIDRMIESGSLDDLYLVSRLSPAWATMDGSPAPKEFFETEWFKRAKARNAEIRRLYAPPLVPYTESRGGSS